MKTVTFDEAKWQLVPIEPTEEMRTCLGLQSWTGFSEGWNAMLACVTQPAKTEQEN